MSSWIVHLKDIPPEGLVIGDSVDLADTGFDEDVIAHIRDVTLDCRVKRISGGLILEGRGAFSADIVCSRCLEEFPASFDYPIRLLLTEGESDDPGTFSIQDNNLNVTRLAEEMCHLQVPMKPLCKEECRGLCPVCGSNLNTTTCGCAGEMADPRLQILKELKKEINHG